METTINFFKASIEVDPNYALAHAQLAYAYAWTALFIEPTEPSWAERQGTNQPGAVAGLAARRNLPGAVFIAVERRRKFSNRSRSS
jgi:hypothetical protein